MDYWRERDLMPSSTPKQAKTMAACAHGADLEVCKHIPLKVAKEFNAADANAHIGHSLTSPGGLVQRGGYMDKRGR